MAREVLQVDPRPAAGRGGSWHRGPRATGHGPKATIRCLRSWTRRILAFLLHHQVLLHFGRVPFLHQRPGCWLPRACCRHLGFHLKAFLALGHPTRRRSIRRFGHSRRLVISPGNRNMNAVFFISIPPISATYAMPANKALKLSRKNTFRARSMSRNACRFRH